MKRRAFLQTSSMISLPLLLNGLKITAITRSNLFHFIDGESDKVLVLINLIGGNDGLNTVIPLDFYDQLAKTRSNIIIPEDQLIQLTDKNSLHPGFSGMQNLFDDAKLKIIQNVGYPNQNRSHFRSTDIWTTASDADEFLTSGWLGRFFDNRFAGYPENYPNVDNPDPIAITLGYVVSETCQGQVSNFSVALNDPDSLNLLQEPEDSEVPDTCYGNELTFIRNAIKQTNAYTETITNAAESGSNQSSKYNDDNGLSRQLKTVARLISGGLRTKVYVVSIGGFDTHANQVQAGNPMIGEHAGLLSSLSEAICAFQDDLRLMDLEDKVVGMTYSEFGRRIKSNFSNGTDHGSAAPLFVFGKCVNPGILGDNPEISEDVGVQDGVPMQFDFRSVYGSILMDWFDASEEEVREILLEDFTYIPIVAGCKTTSIDYPALDDQPSVFIYPNPFRDQAILQLHIKKSHIRVSMFDALGGEIKIIVNKTLPEGDHNIPIYGADLPAGNYFLRIVSGNYQVTKLVQKVGY